MAYKALYRTYRPSTFEEVAGQKHIVRTLENALEQQKMAHAYLFTGPRGTGKTTMAKLVAKALNCEEGIGHQCNHCSNCIAINEGSHPDVIEIDAASNNGVEDVRDLIERVKYSPMKGRYKVYIIDEVHMMSASAFNALLKTLEEPPSHVIFILATTEPHKVLPTILSRCQRYDFTKVDEHDIDTRMKESLLKENISYEEEALRLIISLADGGMRDALSLLDQSIAYAGDHLTLLDLEELFGLAGLKERKHLLQAIIHGDYSEVLHVMNLFIEHGVDIRRLTSDLLIMLKDVLIYQKTKNTTLLVSLKTEDMEDWMELSSKHIAQMIDILINMQSEFKTVNNIRSLFEISLLKMTGLFEKQEETIVEKKMEKVPVQEKQDIPPFLAKTVHEEKPVEVHTPVVETVVTPTVQEKPVTKVEVKEEKVVEPEQEELPPFLRDLTEKKNIQPMENLGEENQLDDETMIKIMVTGNKEEKQKLNSVWPTLSRMIFDPNIGKYASLLKDGTPYVLCKEVLVLQYELATLASKVNIKANQAMLKEIIGRLLGRNVAVYAVSRSEAVRLYSRYQNLYQVGRLPRANEVIIEVKL